MKTLLLLATLVLGLNTIKAKDYDIVLAKTFALVKDMGNNVREAEITLYCVNRNDKETFGMQIKYMDAATWITHDFLTCITDVPAFRSILNKYTEWSVIAKKEKKEILKEIADLPIMRILLYNQEQHMTIEPAKAMFEYNINCVFILLLREATHIKNSKLKVSPPIIFMDSTSVDELKKGISIENIKQKKQELADKEALSAKFK